MQVDTVKASSPNIGSRFETADADGTRQASGSGKHRRAFNNGWTHRHHHPIRKGAVNAGGHVGGKKARWHRTAENTSISTISSPNTDTRNSLFSGYQNIIDADFDTYSEELQAWMQRAKALIQSEVVSPSALGSDFASSSAGEAVQVVSRYEEARSFSLNLLTQDGDTVQISISNAQGSALANFLSKEEGQIGYSLNRFSASEENFLFSVNGDLDAGEMEAITGLVADIAEVAQNFYGGNLQEALDAALALEMDSTELAGFNLDMSQRQKIEQAAVFLTPSQSTADEAEISAQSPPISDTAKGLHQKIRDLYQKAYESILQDPVSAVNSLLDAFMSRPENRLS